MAATMFVADIWTGASVSGAQAREEPLDAVHVRKTLLESQEHVSSVFVEYEISDPGSPGVPRAGYLHREVAGKGPYFFYHYSAHGHNSLKWQNDPLQQKSIVTASQWVKEWCFNRIYVEGDITATESPPGSLAGEFFFIATGLWPMIGRRAPQFQHGPCVLREVAQNDRYCAARISDDIIDGCKCVILEYPGFDTLWLAPEQGMALKCREERDPTTGGRTIQRFTMTGHTEVARGVWLPMTIRNEQFGARPVDATAVILQLRVNDLDDKLFDFVARKGSAQVSESGELRQVVADGIEHLDAVARFAAANRRILAGATPASVIVRFWPGLAVGAILVLVLLGLARKRT